MDRICLIGDIFVDVTLKTRVNPLKMRLGGIIHSARSLWALNIDYSLAYFAPRYLISHIEAYLEKFGNPETFYLGEVETSPYVMLIQEAKETGNQGYEFILRDNLKIKYDDNCLEKLKYFSRVLVISGNYDLHKIFTNLSPSCKISIDLANNINEISSLIRSQNYETIFLSTSSSFFLEYYEKEKDFQIRLFFEVFIGITKRVVLKENRGGSRAFDFLSSQLFSIPSQTQTITHSVGVGDVYDAVCVVKQNELSFEESLHYASWIATEYALTTFPEDFKIMTKRILGTSIKDIIALGGVSLPWEKRKKINIYIAAPDFDFVETSLIDQLCESLSYHNFSPRRPIAENGQMESNASKERKKELFQKDMKLLSECQVLIAVLLYNDPGTLLEIGLASERGLPTLVYDPFNISSNCMLTQLPEIISADLDEIISGTFTLSQKIVI